MPQSAAPRSRATSCAVTISVARKVSTASSEGSCSEASPQMPWHEVQPPPMRAPKPAMKPPTASCHSGASVRQACPPPPVNSHRAAPTIGPAM